MSIYTYIQGLDFMPDKNKLNLGKLARGTQYNIGGIIAGVILMIIGVWLGLTGINDEYSEKIINLSAMLLGFLLIIGGLASIIISCSRSIDKIYCIDNKCVLTSKKYECMGGCRRCAFALAYLNTVNEGEPSNTDAAPSYPKQNTVVYTTNTEFIGPQRPKT